jgi:hypothetical protein
MMKARDQSESCFSSFDRSRIELALLLKCVLRMHTNFLKTGKKPPINNAYDNKKSAVENTDAFFIPSAALDNDKDRGSTLISKNQISAYRHIHSSKIKNRPSTSFSSIEGIYLALLIDAASLALLI